MMCRTCRMLYSLLRQTVRIKPIIVLSLLVKCILSRKNRLLEPMMKVEVTVPDEYLGDVMGDMNKRRGRILGTDMANGKQIITAEVPQAEMFRYATDLRSMTQGRGKFEMHVVRYEEVPAMNNDKIIADAKKREEEANKK